MRTIRKRAGTKAPEFPFPYKTATVEQVFARAGHLTGMRLGDVLARCPATVRPKEDDKGGAGKIVEAFFSIRGDTSQAADFFAAGIELKVVPLLRRRDKSLRSKERTVVTMIDFHDLVAETWPTATVRDKLASILMVFYLVDPLKAIDEWEIVEVVHWEISDAPIAQFQEDWINVKGKVVAGRAHEVSESDGRALGAARKGGMRSQPFSHIMAKGRAWALKQGYTEGVLLEARSGSTALLELDVAPRSVEQEAIDVIAEYRGQTIAGLNQSLGRKESVAKSAHVDAIKALLEARGFAKAKLRLHGLNLKTIAAATDLSVYESMSFPVFDPLTLGLERWETSDLLSQIERMLVVVLFRRTKAVKTTEYVVGQAFTWSPSQEDLRLIREEWLHNVRLINRGHYDRLPKESKSRRIHVRTHGLDSSDQNAWPTESGGKVMRPKRSFWLNESYLESILGENVVKAVWPPS